MKGSKATSSKIDVNALDFSVYIARQMSSIVECCREGVAKRSRLFSIHGSTNVEHC